jgi:OOP family OmpA-OmpF porin
MLKKQIAISIASVSIAAVGAGCAGQRPASLDRAQSSLTQAQQDPAVAQYAPAQLSEARATLTQAERVWDNERDSEETSHLAYLTEQKAGIAVAVAQQKVAEDEAQRLRAQQENIRLGARTREAEFARAQAETATEQAQAATDQAVAATARSQALEQELAALKASDTERGLVMTLQEGVLFEYNKAELKSGAMRSLEPLITFLREHPDRTLLIEGHTDSTGSNSYNSDLSQRRAEAVRGFLASNGISADRIVARGYGESYPVTTNTTEAGRQQNRRVEVVIAHAGQRIAERR